MTIQCVPSIRNGRTQPNHIGIQILSRDRIRSVATAKRSRDLTPEQNEHVRALVRQLLREHTQTSLGPKIGLKQNSLSNFLSGGSGTSFSTARRAAAMAKVDVEDLLAGRVSSTRDPYPIRERVLALAADDVHPQAREFVRGFEPKGGASLTAVDWMRMLAHWDDMAKRGMMP